jgi:hypothetical protein
MIGQYIPFNDGYGIVGYKYLCPRCNYLSNFTHTGYCPKCKFHEITPDPDEIDFWKRKKRYL